MDLCTVYCPAGVEVSAALAVIILSLIILSMKSGVSNCFRLPAPFVLSLSSDSLDGVSREEVLPDSVAAA